MKKHFHRFSFEKIVASPPPRRPVKWLLKLLLSCFSNALKLVWRAYCCVARFSQECLTWFSWWMMDLVQFWHVVSAFFFTHKSTPIISRFYEKLPRLFLNAAAILFDSSFVCWWNCYYWPFMVAPISSARPGGNFAKLEIAAFHSASFRIIFQTRWHIYIFNFVLSLSWNNESYCFSFPSST